ncbi:phosphatase [Clostridium botulinum]|uniref:fused DSP-PTPase phosphatase/NAD kinase-like protein n=1 Tax=Clostridium botulinum TaxID=1491 RepID=UPI00052BB3B2|nr:phosphatase [Clostridium botulinum]KGM98229.1 phosphatase [Clostridium botulinum D str. CCUG 7971]KOC50438.1 phosphatase [Clostridium botulinum]NFO97044.1 phosphatase [Clostridium botulinum]OOV51175.1 phosphatase [Clostridium botulinum D/C]OOV56262.1 phosphatase [Clostridium botulinum D/C]
MKNYMKKTNFCFTLFILLFLISIPVNAKLTSTDAPVPPKPLVVLDSNSTSPLPNFFRIIPELNISGSKQFTPAQLKNIQNKINSKNLYIVDLREESHGFINDNTAISFYLPRKYINDKFTVNEVLEKETTNLNSINDKNPLNIYNQTGTLLTTIKPQEITSEIQLVQSNNINYVRLPVIDNYIPNPEIVDTFIELIKSKPSNSHLHFHCKEGQGRTTMFMAMYEMMHNEKNFTLDEILKHQQDAGGIVLTGNPARATFLKNFYDYTTENKKNNFHTSYSQWLKNKNS